MPKKISKIWVLVLSVLLNTRYYRNITAIKFLTDYKEAWRFITVEMDKMAVPLDIPFRYLFVFVVPFLCLANKNTDKKERNFQQRAGFALLILERMLCMFVSTNISFIVVVAINLLLVLILAFIFQLLVVLTKVTM